MRRREFLKNAASTVIAGSLGATAGRADEKTTGEVRMSKVQANGITINYEQQGTGEPLVLIPYLAADMPVMPFRSLTMPSTSPVSRLTREERAKLTSRTARIRWNYLPTTSPLLCRRLESSVRM